jgi:hypothetical protein
MWSAPRTGSSEKKSEIFCKFILNKNICSQFFFPNENFQIKIIIKNFFSFLGTEILSTEFMEMIADPNEDTSLSTEDWMVEKILDVRQVEY